MRPLQDMKVVDLTHALSGPYCTYQLGLLGAEIIKVESPGGGDNFRQFLPETFVAVNAGKKSVTLELGSDSGQEILDKLIAQADVVVENFKASTSEKLGLTPDRFKRCNPRIVSCSIRGFAGDSQFAGMPAVEWSVQAQMGLTALYLSADQHPRDLGIGMLDVSTGANAASAILAGLLERGRTNDGQHVEVTMADAAMMLFSPHIDKQLKGMRKGKAPTRAGVGRFVARDRPLFIMAATPPWFASLSDILGDPALSSDPRFADPANREKHADDLHTAVEERLVHEDADFWEKRLLDRGVPAAVVRDFPEAVALGGVGNSHSLIDAVASSQRDTVRIFGSGIGGEAALQPLRVPALGEHTQGILAGLNLSQEGETKSDTSAVR